MVSDQLTLGSNLSRSNIVLNRLEKRIKDDSSSEGDRDMLPIRLIPTPPALELNKKITGYSLGQALGK